MDRRRGYDQQVLKEMVGLMVQSFFNHTPAIPDKDKKAALHSGKVRFNRFLDTLATHLRSGQSITNDIPAAPERVVPEPAEPSRAANGDGANDDSTSHSQIDKPRGTLERKPRQPHAKSEEPQPEKSSSDSNGSRWNLFGIKES
jgi:hypothetical protein